MAASLRVTIEAGPRGKRVVAVAPDWPGLERGAKTEAAAIETLVSYLPRYAAIARTARMTSEFAAQPRVDVVERYEGTGSTDFWGISFGFSSLDACPLSSAELTRHMTIMRACWSYFDLVRAHVSAEMRKGPRGGGRDRDEIVRHVLAVEQDWAKKVGLHTPDDEVVTNGPALDTWRAAYCDTLREHHEHGRTARNWPLRYLIRHTAYHAMDHAWEMQDKDLGGSQRS